MKFGICSTVYENDLLDKYPKLKEFGFDIEERQATGNRPIRDEDGRWIIQERTVTVKEPYIYIYSLEELIKLHDELENELIISSWKDRYSIEIYDGYRE